jgi:hypothetical protein
MAKKLIADKFQKPRLSVRKPGAEEKKTRLNSGLNTAFTNDSWVGDGSCIERH